MLAVRSIWLFSNLLDNSAHFIAETFGTSSINDGRCDVSSTAKSESWPIILVVSRLRLSHKMFLFLSSVFIWIYSDSHISHNMLDPRGNRNIPPWISYLFFYWFTVDSVVWCIHNADVLPLWSMLTVRAPKNTFYWWNNRRSCNGISLLRTQHTMHIILADLIHTKVYHMPMPIRIPIRFYTLMVCTMDIVFSLFSFYRVRSTTHFNGTSISQFARWSCE